jgi:hypothetical protein
MTYNKCKHVFKQGDKKGKKCNAQCKGEYCKRHNTKQKEYQKKYYDENIKKPIEFITNQKIKSIESITDIRNITNNTIGRIEMKYFNDYFKPIDELKNIIKGIRLYLGLVTEFDLYKPFIQKMINLGELTEEELNDSIELARIENKPMSIKYLPNRIFQKLPISTRIYTTYNENKNISTRENKKNAKKKLDTYITELSELQEESKYSEKILNAYRKRRHELLDMREKKKLDNEDSEESEELEEDSSLGSEDKIKERINEIKQESEESEESEKIKEISIKETCDIEIRNIEHKLKNQLNVDNNESIITEDMKEKMIKAYNKLINECDKYIDVFSNNKELKVFVDRLKSIKDNILEIIKRRKNIQTIEENEEEQDNEEINNKVDDDEHRQYMINILMNMPKNFEYKSILKKYDKSNESPKKKVDKEDKVYKGLPKKGKGTVEDPEEI